MRLRNLGLASLLCLAILLPGTLGRALPGEAATTVARCGVPTGENQTDSMITGGRRRDLIYGSLILHYEPMGSGWSFTTAWYGHLPLSRAQVEARFPCFRRAMQDAASQPGEPVDPTIAAQMAERDSVNSASFGVPLFWPMVLCAVVLLIAIAWRYGSYEAEAAATVSRTAKLKRVYRAPDLSRIPPLERRGDVAKG